ncbi:MAG: hypothetical protein RR827_05845 [Oscillospiraceae bacterium]
MVTALPFIGFAAPYNPLAEKDENISNLEKARILLEYFQKSEVDSNWAYDIESNKETVELMLEACAAMTDDEIGQLSAEEKKNFNAYFKKLYEVSGLDVASLGDLFDIKGLPRAVDEISHVEDRKIASPEVSQWVPPQEQLHRIGKISLLTAAFLLVLGVSAAMLSRAIKKVYRPGEKKL